MCGHGNDAHAVSMCDSVSCARRMSRAEPLCATASPRPARRVRESDVPGDPPSNQSDMRTPTPQSAESAWARPSEVLTRSRRTGRCACISQELTLVLIDGIDVEHADRTHDLRIMKPTRCQLRYFRLVWLSRLVAMHMMPSEQAQTRRDCSCSCCCSPTYV